MKGKNILKTVLILLLISLLLGSQVGCTGPACPGVYTIEIEVAGFGLITAELDPIYAPITVENFVQLAESGFYDGLTFHRIIGGFMIQGGCDLGTGTGGSSERIVGEFAANGIENPLSHTRGVLSMARMGHDYDSASSQFFIVHADSTFLDGDYASFGWVTDGMDVVDEIVSVTPTGPNGETAPENQPVITGIRVIR